MLTRWLNRLRCWHKTLDQSIENPLQADRLPDTSSIELEYPATQFSMAENRRYTLRQLIIVGMIVMYLAYIEVFFQILSLAPYIHSVLSSAAFIVLIAAFFDHLKSFKSFFLCSFLGCFVCTAFLLIHHAVLFFIVASVCAMLVADRLTGHFFYLKTTVPMPRARAERLRLFWQNRLKTPFHTAMGLELYPLSLFSIAAIPPLAIYFFWQKQWLPFAANLLLVAIVLPSLLFLPWILEGFVAFLYQRSLPRTTLRTMRLAFWTAVVQWFTYNRLRSTAPGIFQSPFGSCRRRRWMALATIILFATWFVQMFSSDYNTKVSHKKRPQIQNLTFTATPQSQPEDSTNTDEFHLEPYQNAMLNRLPEDERQQQLAKYREQAQASSKTSKTPQHLLPGLDSDDPKEAADSGYKWLFLYIIVAIPLLTILCTILPSILFLACCFTASARVVGVFAQQYGIDNPERVFSQKTWDHLVRCVQESRDKIEKESILLGVNAHDDTPVIVPRSVFTEHAHLLGDSGSGKTTLGLSSLMSQLIRFRDCSLVVLDLKGDDLALLENAREEAADAERVLQETTKDSHARYPFRWFTNELHRNTYVFNPFLQSFFDDLTIHQKADFLTAALGLQYGTDYGRSYYSDANAELLHKAIRKNPKLRSFAEIAEIFRHPQDLEIHPELRRAASHIYATISRLAACKPLCVTPADGYPETVMDNAIDFTQVFRQPQALYFHLPSIFGATSCAEIARLALYSILAAAKHVGPGRCQAFLMIDEFQRIISSNLEMILQTARSMNIGVILANQSLMDLQTAGVNLIPTVRANTRFRQIFAASDLDTQQELVQASGETIVHNRSWTEYLASGPFFAGAASRVFSQHVSSRLRRNDILLATDHPLQSIVHIRRSAGYAQFGGMPFVMTSAFHISEETYKDRRKATWPENPQQTIPVSPDADDASEQDSPPWATSQPSTKSTPIVATSPPLSAPTAAPELKPDAEINDPLESLAENAPMRIPHKDLRQLSRLTPTDHPKGDSSPSSEPTPSNKPKEPNT